jgi:UDP-glucose 4-epimerase
MKKNYHSIVTGGAGFIGSHLTEQLLLEGHCVTVIDNFSTGRKENLAHLVGNKRLEIVNANINDNASKIEKYFKNIDWVFHLAALAAIVPSINHPLEYYHTNVDGTVNILEICRKSKSIKKIIYSASSSCYGFPKIIPTPEDAPIDPQYPYALTKYLGECCLLHWGKVYKMPVISLRLFNVYGPRSRTSGAYGAVIGTFLAQKLAKSPFTVVGDGTQTRDFIYVSDVVRAFLEAAKSNISDEIFNVGSDGTYSINELVGLIGGSVTYIPKRPGEPDITLANISKIKRMLGWKPKVSFKEGMYTVMQNIDYWKNATVWTPKSIQKATKDWFKYLKNN